MKRIRLLTLGVVVLMLGSSVSVSAGHAHTEHSQDDDFRGEHVEQWHEAVHNEYSAIQSGKSEEEIYRCAFEAVVRAYEIEHDHETAVKKAKESWGQQMALYWAALDNGIEATEEEIKEEIDEYKRIMQEPECSSELKDLMISFSSEEDFWEYQASQSKIWLTVEKYLRSVGTELAEELGMDVDSKFLPTSWYDGLDRVKSEAVEEYKEEIEAMFTE